MRLGANGGLGGIERLNQMVGFRKQNPMTNTITLTIDGEPITVPEGTTILEAAKLIGKEIPVICYHDATTSNGLCRVCVVDVNGGRLLQPACIVQCQPGMNVETRNERVETSRKTILEMLNSAVDLTQAPEIQQMMDDYNADPQRFPNAKRREHPVYDDNPFYIRDYSQCILCWRCTQVCAEDAQYTFALTLANRGYDTHVATSFDVGMTESPCVFCGQCIGVCPTGALKPKIEYGLGQGWTMEDIWQKTRLPRKGKKRD
jgi:predicted molibdopterin-dependent oxidoreductase YjgC